MVFGMVSSMGTTPRSWFPLGNSIMRSPGLRLTNAWPADIPGIGDLPPTMSEIPLNNGWGAGPPFAISVCTISTEGAPSLRFLQGWAAMLHALLDLFYGARRDQACATRPSLKIKVRFVQKISL
jgi:hypothetical protein